MALIKFKGKECKGIVVRRRADIKKKEYSTNKQQMELGKVNLTNTEVLPYKEKDIDRRHLMMLDDASSDSLE